jgi:hypothetical protein
VRLTAFTARQREGIYLSFAKELYFLSRLRSDRVVTVYGCVTELEELSIVMQVTSSYLDALSPSQNFDYHNLDTFMLR